MKKYYFIFGKTERDTHRADGSSTRTVQEFQDIIDVHPIQYQIDCNKRWGHFIEQAGGYKVRECYTIMSWQKLTKAEYDKFNGEI